LAIANNTSSPCQQWQGFLIIKLLGNIMFKFDLGQLVKIGNYHGGAEIIARAEYLKRPNQYLVKYHNEAGLPVLDWFDEEDIA